MEKTDFEKNKNFALVADFVKKAEGQRRSKVEECTNIQNLYAEQFSLAKTGGKRALNGFLLFQCLWKTITKMRMLDYRLKSPGLDEDVLAVVRDAVDNVVRKSGLTDAFTEKSGAFFRGLLFGDAFIRIGSSAEQTIRFEACSLNDVWIDPLALEMRSEGGGIDAQEMAVSYHYSVEGFKKAYPEFAKKEIKGAVPFYDFAVDDEKKDFVQVVHYYSKRDERYIVLAGAEALTIKEASGVSYPFHDLGGRPYLPLLHFVCFPSLSGFYNAGLGNLLYNLHVETRRLMNMAIAAIANRVDPLYTITMKKSKIAEFQNWVYKALEAKSRGEMGIIPMEVDENGQGEYGQVRSLIGERMSSEFERLFAQYDQIVKRIGINLDDLGYDGGTARQALIREESANGFVRQIMEQNAAELRFAIESVLSAIRDFVPHDDKTLVAVAAKVGGEPVKGVTLGMVSEILGRYEFCVEVDSTSGAYPSHVAELGRIDELIGFLPAGSAAQKRAILKKSRLLGFAVDEGELAV